MSMNDTTEARERLAEAVEKLTDSETFAAWLRARASFRSYSFGNVCLIASQRPDASRVAGYRAWQGLGRNVMKGERSIKILAPCVRKVEDKETGEQAKRVVAKIHGGKVKMQVGVQGMSDDSYKTANRFIKEGALGKVVLAQIDYSRNHRNDFWADPAYPIDTDVRPGVNLDWKAFLGNTPKRPFDPDRFFRWRRYWDYSGGIAGDLFVHRATRIIKSLGLTFPSTGVGSGGKFEFKDSVAEVPDTINFLLDYPEGLTLQLVSSMANDSKIDHLIRGHKATLEFTKTGFAIHPQALFKDDVKEIVHEKSGAEDLALHHRNLHNAIRNNEELNCDVNLGYYGVVAAEMGNLSYRKRKYMKWDAAKERIVNA